MPMSTIEVALLTVLVFCGSLGFGYLLVSATLESLVDDRRLLWVLALPGVVAYSVVLTLVHALSGGELWSRPPVVWALTAAVAVVLATMRYRRRHGGHGIRRSELAIVLAGVLGSAVWALPALNVVPLVVGGDHFHHMAWTNQLLNGEALPTGSLTGTLPNDYPWGFHGLSALLTAFLPTADPYLSLHPLQLLLPFGGVLGFFALGRQAFKDTVAGAASAVLGAASGGFGFLLRLRTGLVVRPRQPGKIDAFFGDYLQRRSYNLSFGNISPPFPRDVTFVLLPVVLWLLLVGIERDRRRNVVAAGVTLGVCGLIGGDVLITGMVVGTCTVLLAPGASPRLRTLAHYIFPALGVWSIWFVPIVIRYATLGGFRDLSSTPVDLSVAAVIGGWGVAFPLALVGLWAGRRSVKKPGVVVAGCLLSVPLMIILFPPALVPNDGFATLLRDHRYWPIVYAGLALFGGLGTSHLLALLKSRALQLATALVLLIIAVSSPVAASIGSLDRARRGAALIQDAMIGDPRALLSLIRGPVGIRRNIAVPRQMEDSAYSYTGYRLVHHFPHRLRFPGVFEHIPTEKQRKEAMRTLMSPLSPEEWLATARRFDLDLIVLPTALAGNPNLPPCEVVRPSSPEGAVVIFTADCSGFGPG
jgi:hypothetical protein